MALARGVDQGIRNSKNRTVFISTNSEIWCGGNARAESAASARITRLSTAVHTSYQAKQHEEMQAVADALSLLANLVMAWNTMRMQSVFDRWNARLSTAVPSDLIGRIAPTRTEGINLRGVFTFPIEQYQAQLLPSLPAAKSRAFGS